MMALLSAVSSLLPFSYGATRLSSKASLASTTSRFNLSSLRNSPRNSPCLYVSMAIANLRWFWLTSLNVLCSSQCCMSFSPELGWFLLLALNLSLILLCRFTLLTMLLG
ncbi:unnamed protein product [Brassica rapa subsp. trilocularis]